MSIRRIGYLRLVLFAALSTAGAAIIHVEGVPLYRRLLAGEIAREGTPETSLVIRAMTAIALMQASHWARVLRYPIAQLGASLPVAYVFSFTGRLSFVLAGGLFSATVLVRAGEIQMSFPRVALTMGVLFAMYCYSLDLDAFARAFSPSASTGSSTANKS